MRLSPFGNRSRDSVSKRIVVLAFSFKHGGRCIAGREVSFDSSGRPMFGSWIRPVSSQPSGELLAHHYQFENGRPPEVLDILDIAVRNQQRDDQQPENWLLDESVRPELVGRLDAVHMTELVEEPEGIWLEPGRLTDRVSAAFLEDYPPCQSLYFVRINDVEVSPDARNGFRLGFAYRDEWYRLKITDANFERAFRPWLMGSTDASPLRFAELNICLSIGLEFEGYHYKLAAGIVPPRSGVPLFTFGHSNRTIEEFVHTLKLHGINAVADVRSLPSSQRFPQFAQNALKFALSEAGIRYVHLGDEFGARRIEPECYVNGQVQYDIAAQTQAFQNGIRRILDGSSRYAIALMCAERDPLACHRTILVCRHLSRYGFKIAHIIDDVQVESHQELETRLCLEEKINPGQAGLFQDSPGGLTPLALAYSRRADKIAHREEAGQVEGVHDRVYAEDS